jgi:RNA polymerase sigma-70 factor (ECF subfamily)
MPGFTGLRGVRGSVFSILNGERASLLFQLSPLELTGGPRTPTVSRQRCSPQERIVIAMETPENILVARAQSGSEDAFAELAREHSGKIYKYSLRILQNREDAEDNLQNVLLQAFRNIKSFQDKSQFSTWLVGIAINEALMKLRKRRQDKFVPLQDASHFLSPTPSPEVQATQAEVRALLIKEILRLSPVRRNEILRFTMGEKRNTSTQKSTRFRAKSQLREQLSYLFKRRIPRHCATRLCVFAVWPRYTPRRQMKPRSKKLYGSV